MKRIAVLFSLLLALLVPASAQLTMTGVGGGFGAAGGGGSVSFTYTGGQADTTSSGQTTVTFSSLTVSSGYNVVAFAPAVGGPVTSMTICGTGATFLGSAQGDSWATEMWGASVSGGTCSVVVNLTAASFGSVMAYGVLSGANTTPAAIARLNSPTTFSASQGTTSGLTLTGGTDLGLVANSTQNNFGATVWTGATNVGFVPNTRPANMSMATMSASATPTATNQAANVGAIVALKFTP